MTREIPQIKPSESHRRSVRTLLRACRSGSLGTTLRGEDAVRAPYVSLVTHATLPDASPVFLLSELADHTRNLRENPHAAFLVEQASGLPNPQTGPRATVTGTLRQATGEDLDLARTRFLARHPGAALYAGFGDFAFWVMDIDRIHLIGGFARAVWIDDGPGLPTALCRDLQAMAASACQHMNSDHADAVTLLATTYGGPGSTAEGWIMAALDADGIDLSNGETSLRISFPNPLREANELQPTLVALIRAARAASQ